MNEVPRSVLAWAVRQADFGLEFELSPSESLTVALRQVEISFLLKAGSHAAVMEVLEQLAWDSQSSAQLDKQAKLNILEALRGCWDEIHP
ncbi:MAG: hypothetical protein LBC97_01980 [Bifidobacteriaceae bacterium]|jgi:hypothetical protein|nr:hypothetical protein [Bifidobacteriaceae bacterium]